MLAVGMNGEPLPPVARLPGPDDRARASIGYVSATKWLVELELTTFEAYDPYWVERGWAEEGPIKTMSRIDAPKPLARLPAGKVAIGGVAWAQHRGIDRVEVRIDRGATGRMLGWRRSTRSTPGASGSSSGTQRAARHALEVRATDASGDDPAGGARGAVSERGNRMALRRRDGDLTGRTKHVARADAPGGSIQSEGT